MFSHYVHQLESSGSLEGHRTLIVHECLTVAAALGWYHRWQRQVSHQDRENSDWNKVLVIAKDNFRQKYSPTLTLLGSTQNSAYAHPKLLGCCYDNVYHNGWFIGDLSARGKPPTEEQAKKIYDQEYEEVVARIENILDLMDESNPEPREYEMDGARGLVDLDWSQHMPIFQPDDVDCDPRFSQYPYQEGDDYEDDDEEDMEVESRPLGQAGDAPMVPPTNTRHLYHHPPATYSYESAQTPDSPRSTHTDTDTTIEMGGLSMAPGGPDTHRMAPKTSAPQSLRGPCPLQT